MSTIETKLAQIGNRVKLQQELLIHLFIFQLLIVTKELVNLLDLIIHELEIQRAFIRTGNRRLRMR